MPSILDDATSPAKILLIGKSGAGKTGSLAALVAAGYNLRIIDTDKGIKPLKSLLTDTHYPYSQIIRQKEIDLNKAVRYISIDTSMKLRSVTQRLPDGKTTSTTLLAPTNANAWGKVMSILDNWKEPDLDLGSVYNWSSDDVLVIDSFSTLARCAYYFGQSLNNRLGARDVGFDYQRDIGEAQNQLTRLLELLSVSNIKCNVIIISHITWIDESQGVATRPKDPSTGIISTPDGHPSAIGRALSPQMGKYFNDMYIVRSSGSGASVSRSISTVPQDGVIAKNSVYLDREYPVSYGLAAIFASLQGKPAPTDLIAACGSGRRPTGAPNSASKPLSSASQLAVIA